MNTNGIRIQCNTENFVPIVVPGLSASSSSSFPSSTSMTPSAGDSSSYVFLKFIYLEHCDPLTKPTKNPTPNKNENSEKERSDPLCSDIPEWLQEFRENLVDDRVRERRDSHASSSHEPSLEPTTKRREDLCKQSVHTHFPKDRNREICQRTQISRGPCRRRVGGAVPRADFFL